MNYQCKKIDFGKELFFIIFFSSKHLLFSFANAKRYNFCEANMNSQINFLSSKLYISWYIQKTINSFLNSQIKIANR